MPLVSGITSNLSVCLVFVKNSLAKDSPYFNGILKSLIPISLFDIIAIILLKATFLSITTGLLKSMTSEHLNFGKNCTLTFVIFSYIK